MSHIHLPDGILPFWLWIIGYIFVGIFLTYFSFNLKKYNTKKMALVGTLAALMLITMSLELPIGYHLNLSVLTGILLGPILSVIAIFSVNIITALLAHGGVTVIGLNTLVISIEAITGYFLFKLISAKTKKIFLSTFVSAFLALIVSFLVTTSIIYLGTKDIGNVVSLHNHHHEVVNTDPHEHHEIDDHIEQHNHDEISAVDKHEEHENDFDIKRFFAIVFTVGIIGWLLESFITTFIVNYINKVKPDLLDNQG